MGGQLGPDNLYILKQLTSPVKMRKNTALSYVCHLYTEGVVDISQNDLLLLWAKGPCLGFTYASPSHPSCIKPYTSLLPCRHRHVHRACLAVTLTFQLGKPRQRHVTLSYSRYFGAEPQTAWQHFTAPPKPMVVFSSTLGEAPVQLVWYKGLRQEHFMVPTSTRVCSFVRRHLVSFQSRLKNASCQHPVLWGSCFCKVSEKAKDRDLMLGGTANTEVALQTQFLADSAT